MLTFFKLFRKKRKLSKIKVDKNYFRQKIKNKIHQNIKN